jgi:hypothetical protein
VAFRGYGSVDGQIAMASPGPEQAEQAEQSEDLPQHLGAFRSRLMRL